MNDHDTCPARVDLAKFMDGFLVGPALYQIADHLERCTDCQGAVQTLAPNDTLVETLRGNAPAAEKYSGLVPSSLLDRLNQISKTDSMWRQPNELRSDGVFSTNIESSILPNRDLNGERWIGHYRLVEVLGLGGMGEVFRAEDTVLHRPVAVKIMLPRIAADRTAKDRFLREARAAAGLSSDHIVTVYEVGEVDGLPFIATELLRGQSLDSALRAGRKFSIDEILKIGREVAEGLSVAHANRIVHRDIKCANLWLEKTNKDTFRVKILDFGLARAELDESQLTHASAIIGTPAFMAPEQARGSKTIDLRSDLFSLGCVLYLLCTHKLPFEAETTIETLMAISLETPKSPELIQPETPPELARLVMRLLEKDPKNRPESATEVIAKLEAIESQSSKPVSAHTQSTRASFHFKPTTNASRFRSNNLILIGMALFSLTTIAFASFSILFWQIPDGRIVRIECNDPAIQIAFGNGEMKIAGAFSKPIILQPGRVELKIKKVDDDGSEFVFDTDKLIVGKGDEIALRVELLDSEVKLERIGKGLVDSKQLPKGFHDRKDLTANQRGALWVLSLGGSVILNDNGIGINFDEELPSGDYNVSAVNLATNGQVTDAGLANLSGLSELIFLNLEWTKISDAGVEHLKALRKMKELNLYGTNVTDAGVMHLKNMTDLTFLGLGGRLQIGNSSLVHLRRFQNLKKLYLDGSQVTDAGLPLLRKIGDLELIDLSGTQITDEGLESVSYIENLTELVLRKTNLTDHAMIRIGQLKKLQTLNLSQSSLTDIGLERLRGLENLKTLYVQETNLSADGIQRFRQALPNCTVHSDF